MFLSLYNWTKQNGYTIVKWAILSVLIYFPVFAFLDVLPLRIWDEGRLAESAYEMNKYGNYLVPHIQGNPDMWSVKPPLMIWLQVLSIKALGIGELAIRLPSAIAALLSCLLLMVFCIKYLKSFWWGFASVLVLITSNGYISMHSARSGDYDSLLTLFITFYCLAFYAYTVTQKTKYITLTVLGIILAALTKGIAGLLFLPALCIYAVIKGSIVKLIKSRVFYFNVVLFFVIFLGYYLLREHYNPGYIKSVLVEEWGGRYFDVIEGHQGGFWFYYNNFINFQFNNWFILIPIGIVIGIVSKNNHQRDFILYATLVASLYFFIISCCKTKIIWYDVPMYPFMALIIGSILPYFMELIESKKTNVQGAHLIQFLFIIGVFISPYRAIMSQTYKPDEKPYEAEFYQEEDYLRNAVRGSKNLNGYFVYNDDYNIQDLFYTNILNDRSEKVQFTNQFNFKQGDKIIINKNYAREQLTRKYTCSVIDSLGTLKVYKVLALK